MSKDDVLGLSGAILSSVLAAIGFLWSIGVLQLVFSFLAGAFSTYLVQHRLQVESEKRRIGRENAVTMRDNIYGPILKPISKILDGMKSVQSVYFDDTENLKSIMAHYLFFTIMQDLQNELTELLDRINKYQIIHRAAELLLHNVIRKEIEEVYKVDIGDSPSNEPYFRAYIAGVTVASTSLARVIFQRRHPRGFLREVEEKWGKNLSFDFLGGKTLNDFESMYDAVLHKMEKETVYTQEQEQKIRLIDDLEAFREKIKPFINIL